MAETKSLNVEERSTITVSAPGFEPRAAEAITAADLARQYVASRLGFGIAPILSSLPNASDDITQEFGVSIYDRIKQDAEVSAALDVLVMAATSSKAKFVPPTNKDGVVDPLAQRMADYFDWMAGEFATPFNEWRKAIVEDALSYGSGVGELLFSIEEGGEWDGHYRIADVRPLCMCDTSFVVDNFNRIVGIISHKQPGLTMPIGAYVPLISSELSQEAKQNRLNAVIPRSKFTIFTWNPKCSDPRGRSVLRPIYAAWYAKQQIINLMLDWFKKYSQPSIWATTPQGAQVICEVDDKGNEKRTDPTQKLLEALMSFQNSSAIAVPFGSEIHTLDMSKGGDIFLSAISMCNREITRGIQMQHLATSDSEHMARASSGTHQQVLSLYILQLREWQSETIRRDIVTPLVLANWGKEYAHLAPSVDLGDGDGFPIDTTDVALLGQINWFTEEQKPKIDKVLGLPVRKTLGAVVPDPNAQTSISKATMQTNTQPEQARGGGVANENP